jgi:hypothetical protein
VPETKGSAKHRSALPSGQAKMISFSCVPAVDNTVSICQAWILNEMWFMQIRSSVKSCLQVVSNSSRCRPFSLRQLDYDCREFLSRWFNVLPEFVATTPLLLLGHFSRVNTAIIEGPSAPTRGFSLYNWYKCTKNKKGHIAHTATSMASFSAT